MAVKQDVIGSFSLNFISEILIKETLDWVKCNYKPMLSLIFLRMALFSSFTKLIQYILLNNCSIKLYSLLFMVKTLTDIATSWALIYSLWEVTIAVLNI